MLAGFTSVLLRHSPVAPPWSAIAYASPTTSGTNEDRTVPGSGTVTTDANATGLFYRINSGSWVSYTGGFAITAGQTLGWRIADTVNQSGSEMVKLNSVSIGSFTFTITGF